MITCAFENGNKTSLRHVVVHALVPKDGKLLLAKRAGPILESGKWGLPGGFLERDETAAEAIIRELHEETGWEGGIVSLFRVNSRPDRLKEDRQNVAIEFIVKPLVKTGSCDWETSEIRWFPFEALPPAEEIAFDHVESIRKLISYLKKPFPLPLVE